MTVPYSDYCLISKLNGSTPLSAREVARLVKGDTNHVRIRLDALVDAGKITRKRVMRRVAANNNNGSKVTAVAVYAVAGVAS